MYTEKVIEHFNNPRNVGKMEDADGVGEVGSAQCGDMMCLYIKVRDDRIVDISYETFGCAAAIASSSMLTELVKGKTLEEALVISKQDVSEALDGLPEPKMHCSNMATDALEAAIANYRERVGNDEGNLGKSTDPCKNCGGQDVHHECASRRE